LKKDDTLRWLLPWAVASGLVLIWITLSVWVFDVAFIFHGDHERDLRYVTLWAQHGRFPESSPAIAPLPFELGPMSYFWLLPAVWLSPDPLHVRFWVWALSAAGALVLFDALRRRVHWEAAALALFGLLASTFWYEMSRQLWHSSLLPLPVALWIWSAAELVESERPRRRVAFLCAVSAAVAVQLHMTASIFTALTAGIVVWRFRQLRLRTVAVGTTGWLLAITPMVFTFVRSVERGALEIMDRRPAGRGWSPAGPVDVLEFFVDNVHTIWGDNFGPLLTWVFLGLIGLGVGVAVRGRNHLAILLTANLLLGFVVEALLLGNQEAHRYMHANLFAAFGLAAFGADSVFRALKRQAAVPAGVVALALAVTVEAVTVARSFPLNAYVMEQRVHGVYFGELMGMGHYHALQGAPEDVTAFSPDAHIQVMPSDLGLRPHGVALAEVKLEPAGRAVTLTAFKPSLDHSRLQIQSPAEEALRSRWRRRRAASPGPSQHVIRVPNEHPGTVNLGLTDARRAQDRCRVQVWLGQDPVPVTPVSAPAYEPTLFYEIAVARAGLLTIALGPCQAPRWLDLW
jgi:hypothetical protein